MTPRIKALLEDLYRVQSIPKALREEIGGALQDADPPPSDCGSFNDGIEAAAAWLEEQAKCFIGNAKKELLAEAEDVRGLKRTDGPARGPSERTEGQLLREAAGMWPCGVRRDMKCDHPDCTFRCRLPLSEGQPGFSNSTKGD